MQPKKEAQVKKSSLIQTNKEVKESFSDKNIQPIVKKKTSRKSTKDPNAKIIVNPSNLRYKFDYEIRKYLTQKYQENRIPNKKEMLKMSEKTKLTTIQIMNWFKDMRRKCNHTNPIHFEPEIVAILLKYYKINKYPVNKEVENIAKKTKLTTIQVRQWFSDKRYRSNETTKYYRYSNEAKKYLIEMYKLTKYPNEEQKKELVKKTGLNEDQIHHWFKHLRPKRYLNRYNNDKNSKNI